MKRFHVHVSVEKLDESIRFYSSLFGAAPTVVQPDYATLLLDSGGLMLQRCPRSATHF